jgi:hypothetical protein
VEIKAGAVCLVAKGCLFDNIFMPRSRQFWGFVCLCFLLCPLCNTPACLIEHQLPHTSAGIVGQARIIVGLSAEAWPLAARAEHGPIQVIADLSAM